MMICNRCLGPVDVMTADVCWICDSWLCADCFDKFGSCGGEAEDLNVEARERERHDKLEKGGELCTTP